MVTRQTTIVRIAMVTEYTFLRSIHIDQDQNQTRRRIGNVFHTHFEAKYGLNIYWRNIFFILKRFRFCFRFRSV